MSGIAGLFRFHHNPEKLTEDRHLIQRSAETVAYRGPDGIRHWADGNVVLAHLMLRTTPESVDEVQPLLDDSGALCLVMDGRVDNRAELLMELRRAGAAPRTETDAELVLQAYACWGEQCAAKIVGDFAFAVRDRAREVIYCARDPFGIRPFYYHWNEERFLFGSELRQILADRSIRAEPNEAMVAEYLAGPITSKTETLYRNIFRLAPAHFMVVNRGGATMGRYWNIDPAREIRYGSDEQYAEHFREVFEEAVRCRMRSQRPVGSELSGGLDSSSVVVTAQSLLREGKAGTPGFESFSLVFPGERCDESKYIDAVVNHCGARANRMAPEQFDPQMSLEEIAGSRAFPQPPNIVMSGSLQRAAAGRGFRVMLTGRGGDLWLTGSLLRYADMVREFRIGSLLRQAREDRASATIDDSFPAVALPPLALARAGLWPLLPSVVRESVKGLLGRDGVPGWLDHTLASQVQLAARLRSDMRRGDYRSLAQTHIFRRGTSGDEQHSAEMEQDHAARFGIEKRHPFDDRRLVEFCLALPEEQRWRGRFTKLILRNAMETQLPGLVRDRMTKAEFSAQFVNLVRDPETGKRMKELSIEQAGWVNGERVRELHADLTGWERGGDEMFARSIWPFWMIYGMELWHRSAFGNTWGQTGAGTGESALARTACTVYGDRMGGESYEQ